MERQNCVGSAVLCRDVGAKRYSGVFLSQIVVGCTRYHQFNTIQLLIIYPFKIISVHRTSEMKQCNSMKSKCISFHFFIPQLILVTQLGLYVYKMVQYLFEKPFKLIYFKSIF